MVTITTQAILLITGNEMYHGHIIHEPFQGYTSHKTKVTLVINRTRMGGAMA